MGYINPPFDGEDVPSSEEITALFDELVQVETGERWYNVDYLVNDLPKRFIHNIKRNLENHGYDIDTFFQSRTDLLNIMKYHGDQLATYTLFRNILWDFYKFANCPMEIYTVDYSHARMMSALFKWTSGKFVKPKMHTFLTIVEDEYLLVVNRGLERY